MKWKRLSVLTRILFLPALLFIGLALAGTAAQAQRPVSDDEVNAIAKDMFCPICENTPLDVCPTQACKDWRELIRKQLSEGWTEEQIQDYFVANYGPRVLAQPPTRGFSALVWILPLLGLLGGGIFLWRLLRWWQRSQPVTANAPPPPPSPDIAPEVLSRIEQEVQSRF